MFEYSKYKGFTRDSGDFDGFLMDFDGENIEYSKV